MATRAIASTPSFIRLLPPNTAYSRTCNVFATHLLLSYSIRHLRDRYRTLHFKSIDRPKPKFGLGFRQVLVRLIFR